MPFHSYYHLNTLSVPEFLVEKEMPVFEIDDLAIPYETRRSHRAKRIRIEWKGSSALVVLPHKISDQQTLSFLKEAAPWLYRQAKKQSTQPSDEQSTLHWPSHLFTGAQIPLFGQTLTLKIISGRRLSITRVKREILLQVPEGSKRDPNKILQRWHKMQALKLAERWCKQFCKQINRPYRSVAFKSTKTLWGSCGIHGNIYLNWRLAWMPLGLLRYVVLHECCHLKYRSHGVRFWQLVEKIMPDFKKYEKILKQMSRLLAD